MNCSLFSAVDCRLIKTKSNSMTDADAVVQSGVTDNVLGTTKKKSVKKKW